MAEPQRLADTATIERVRAAIERRAAAAADDARLAEDRAASDDLLRRLMSVRENRWQDLIPRRFWTATIADLEGDARAAAERWIDTGMNANVILLGPTGVGKTHTAAALARCAFDAGSTVRLCSTEELLHGLRPGGGMRWRPERVDVLVLDDLGVEKPTDWSGATLDGIIDRRWKDARPTIVTSNLAPDVIEQHVGPRLWSRLYDGAVRHRVVGDDRRKQT